MHFPFGLDECVALLPQLTKIFESIPADLPLEVRVVYTDPSLEVLVEKCACQRNADRKRRC
jgi:hypothetical protein